MLFAPHRYYSSLCRGSTVKVSSQEEGQHNQYDEEAARQRSDTFQILNDVRIVRIEFFGFAGCISTGQLACPSLRFPCHNSFSLQLFKR
jgi:hypothetical protein